MSTFSMFNTVRLGIYAAQKGLDVTGNNITNINTNGYTRQRVDQISLMTGGSDKTSSAYKGRVGQGAVVTGISQYRDVGMDISYRNAQSNLSATDTKLAGLNDLAAILDEVGKGSGDQADGVILNQLNDLRDLISQAVTNGIDGYEGSIRGSASALASLFNSYANDLQELKEKYEGYLNQDVEKINSILENIQDLNQSIRDADIRGDDALELRDQRNLLLDELSKYTKIDVTYSMEEVGAGMSVEKLTVTLATGNKNTLIDGEYATRFSAGGEADNYQISLSPLANEKGQQQDPAANTVVLGDNDLYGSLQARREILTEEGEYASAADIANDKDAAIKRGIPYYQKALDSLAREFAEQMNALNNVPGIDGAGNLFSTGSDTDNADGITAANISVSKSWAEGKVSMLSSREPNAPSSDRSNLAAFLDLFNKSQSFAPKDLDPDAAGAAYEGSFEDMLLHIESTLGEDQMSTTSVLNNYAATYNTVYLNRDSVTGVDLNDEATNLMVYQKAYTAACQVMTVMQEALDTLINTFGA